MTCIIKSIRNALHYTKGGTPAVPQQGIKRAAICIHFLFFSKMLYKFTQALILVFFGRIFGQEIKILSFFGTF